MYSRQEAAQLKKEFWTTFGQYMKPVPSADGEKVNWINYKTGEKDIRFTMNADKSTAVIAIELTQADAGLRQLYFEQFQQLRNMLIGALGEEWEWQLVSTDDYGKTSSRIYKEISGVSVFDRGDWPELISFFKPRIMALDEFWSTARYAFEALR